MSGPAFDRLDEDRFEGPERPVLRDQSASDRCRVLLLAAHERPVAPGVPASCISPFDENGTAVLTQNLPLVLTFVELPPRGSQSDHLEQFLDHNTLWKYGSIWDSLPPTVLLFWNTLIQL